MTTDELRESIDQIVRILKKNQEAVAPALEKLSGKIRPFLLDPDVPATLSVVMGVPEEDAKSLVAAVTAALDVEQEMVNTPLTDRLVGALETVKGRPVILRLIASFL